MPNLMKIVGREYEKFDERIEFESVQHTLKNYQIVIEGNDASTTSS